MRRHAARRADEQRWDRRRRGERAFLFAPDGRCVSESGLDDWEFAVSICGDVVRIEVWFDDVDDVIPPCVQAFVNRISGRVTFGPVR